MNSNASIRVFFTVAFFAVVFPLLAQTSAESLNERRERHKNMTIREFNTDSKGKNRWMDHVTVYNNKGLRVEEIEYATYGMRQRITSEYDNNDRCVKEVVYNDRNRVERVRKYEYNSDGTKKTQYNYLPNGKLYSTKQYQYTNKGE